MIFLACLKRQWLEFACLVSTHRNEDHRNACSGIQNFVSNSEIENSQNNRKISESTVHVSGVDPGFLERGFMCIKLWRFALLILSHFFFNIP